MLVEHRVLKVSWRGSYDRLWIIDNDRVLTMDPATRKITNEWSLNSRLHIVRVDDHDILMTSNNKSAIRFQCKNRVALLSDYYAAKARIEKDVLPFKIIHCTKYSRKGWESRRLLKLGVRGDAIVQTDPYGKILSYYPYREIKKIQLCKKDVKGIVLTTAGSRSHLFFTSHREELIQAIAQAMHQLSIVLPAPGFITKAEFFSLRRHALENKTSFIFPVQKQSLRSDTVVARKLRISPTCLMEEDSYEVDSLRTIVSVMPLDQIRAIAVNGEEQIEIWLYPNTIKIYQCVQREQLLACILSVTDDAIPIMTHIERPALQGGAHEQYLLDQVVLADGYVENEKSVDPVPLLNQYNLAAFNTYIPPAGFSSHNISDTKAVAACKILFAQLVQVSTGGFLDEIVDLLSAIYRLCSIPAVIESIGTKELNLFQHIVIAIDQMVSSYWITRLLGRLLRHHQERILIHDSIITAICAQLQSPSLVLRMEVASLFEYLPSDITMANREALLALSTHVHTLPSRLRFLTDSLVRPTMQRHHSMSDVQSSSRKRTRTPILVDLQYVYYALDEPQKKRQRYADEYEMVDHLFSQNLRRVLEASSYDEDCDTCNYCADVCTRSDCTKCARKIKTALDTFSSCQVARHNDITSCWIVVQDEVYDVTNYIPQHSNDNGKSILRVAGGIDCTEHMKLHSLDAQESLQQFKIGHFYPCPGKAAEFCTIS